MLSTYLHAYGIGRSFETFGWVLLMTYMPICTFFCILRTFRSGRKSCISPMDMGAFFFIHLARRGSTSFGA